MPSSTARRISQSSPTVIPQLKRRGAPRGVPLWCMAGFCLGFARPEICLVSGLHLRVMRVARMRLHVTSEERFSADFGKNVALCDASTSHGATFLPGASHGGAILPGGLLDRWALQARTGRGREKAACKSGWLSRKVPEARFELSERPENSPVGCFQRGCAR